MSPIELKERLIQKIRATKDDYLIEEAIRLFDLETEADLSIYVLSDDQKKAIAQARAQIKQGEYLTEEESNKEIEEWLGK
jgi:ABC-type transport system involved in cytochrome c biogenesis ATPase subunit